ncbi:ferredoxin, 2Fe-2S [Fontimonas thermophila]|uniref:Ferredoxin, 2Fe-2S n=1 Tax=Fontimonas thermophila TaxID=1076937 RepID=A0A1I2JDY2_9GAMM|nr:2Fe-2S iron-sulfur cluster-binding protein [Fontimonas thermophila]SFF51066.1 ferredoxin, 2Fe-2S [Fontimonas thermophila]
MAVVRVTGRDGVERRLDATNGCALMEALRDANTGIDGTCGGMMSCGTCHVYVDADWLAKLPPKSEDEQMMLDAIGELVELEPGSRLSCQIQVSEALEGLSIRIAPPV